MKVERFLYGMQTGDGKILKIKTTGVDNLLTFKSQETIRQLKPEDSGKYLWFKTEQTIAYPIIREVADKDPKHGGRTWVQNQTYLVNIHEFINHFINNGSNPFQQLIMPELEVFPESFEAVNV